MTAFELNEHLEHLQANYQTTRQLDLCVQRLLEVALPQQIIALARVRGFKHIASAVRRAVRNPVSPE